VHASRLTIREANVARLRQVLCGDDAKKAGLDVVSFRVAGRERGGGEEDETPDVEAMKKSGELEVTGADGSVPAGSAFHALRAPMQGAQASNTLKHRLALEAAASTDKADDAVLHLVLEDDAVANQATLVATLTRAISAAPSDWSVLFLGLPSSIARARNQENAARRAEGKEPLDENAPAFERLADFYSFFRLEALPCCESYLVRPSAAKELAPLFRPVRFVANVQLSWAMQKIKHVVGSNEPRLLASAESGCVNVAARAYVAAPNIFLDGSKLGLFTSAVQPNNRLLWNPTYMEISGMLRRLEAASTAEEDDHVQKAMLNRVGQLADAMTLKNNPDVMYLRAQVRLVQGRVKEAAELMDAAYASYVEQGCILGRSSAFLNAFCDLHRLLAMAAEDDGGGKDEGEVECF